MIRHMLSLWVVGLFVIANLVIWFGQVKTEAVHMTESGQEVLQAAAVRTPCQSGQHRAFDFWLGSWQVTSPSRPNWQAQSHITLGNDGCSIHESYRTPGGYIGSSTSFFDQGQGKWHQTWIDNQGNPLYLNGSFVDGRMVLSDGVNEISWTPMADGRVRQLWRDLKEPDEAKQTVFDGYYKKVK